MTIGAGIRLGPYEIVAPIGAGGMGEVYRARDERLGRDVAIKVLPAGFSADPDRLRRFEQEARAAGALNHPNILAIYDIGTTVEQAPYLVSELLEGETLRERLTSGPLPSRKAIDYGRQIAHGLAAAHAKGIVHRDLKPENLFLTKDGRVKILDFGLAKLTDADPIGARQTSLPTTPAGTQPGIVMGTIGYMSPEQARALAADHRADLFSLGAILYEMLSGRRAFQRDTAADTMGAILLHDPPELSVTNPTISPALELIVRHCLEKNAEERFQSARDVAFALDALSGASTTSGVVVAAGPPKLRWIRRALAGGALLAVLGAGFLVGDHNARNATLSHRMVRSVIPVAPAASLSRDSGAPLMAISPDGTRLVFVGSRGSTTQLYLRNVDQLVAEPIPGTEGGTFPFFSPDGEWIGFGSADGKLKKLSLSGGAALTVCTDCAVIGGSWGSNDTIIVGQGRGGLWRVPAAGGAAQQVTPANKDKGERTLRHPDFLPDGKAVLFTAGGWDEDSFDDARIEVLTLATGEKKVLIQGGMCGRYVASGHLVYARSGSLFAVPFDLATRSVTGVPVRVLEGVSTYPTLGGAQFSVSPGGTLVYAPGGPMRVDHQLVWVDRHGKVEPLTEASRAFLLPRISPDGQRIAILIDTALGHVWVYDLGRGTLTQLTFGENIQGSAVWTPDGKRLAYPWNLYGKIDIYWQPADGSGQPEQLTKGGSEFPGSWSPDGKTLVFAQNSDLWVLPIDGDRKPRLLLEERGLQANAAVSPDGHWLGYDSDESGRPEVYVRRFPGLEEKVQVSASGGESPIWSRDGRELFYREGENKLMAVTISTHATLTAARARIVFEDKESRYLQNGYDVAPDGRFVMVDAHENWPIQLNMVQNWFEELNRKVPTGR